MYVYTYIYIYIYIYIYTTACDDVSYKIEYTCMQSLTVVKLMDEIVSTGPTILSATIRWKM